MTVELEAVIRAEIADLGPMTFARFMELALAHPELGYYAATPARTTRAGDFLTAPELHRVFGQTLARQLDEAWRRLDRPDPFVLRDDGAAAGTLGLDILGGLRADGSGLADALRYRPIELNRHRRAECAERFGMAGLAGRLEVSAGGSAPDAVTPFAGAVVANEYLDALPVHLVERREDRVREVLVGVGPDGAFAEILGDVSTPLIEDRLDALGVALVEGQRAEVCLALEHWSSSVAADLGRGPVIVLDYGRDAADLYDRRRMAGTLMTYRGHLADPSPEAPYRDVGERDITAHVDMTTVRALLQARGLAHLGTTSQAEMLVGCGLEAVLERERAALADVPAALELRSAVARLLDPRRLGGFRALLAGRGLGDGPTLCGLAFRAPSLG